MTNMDYTFGNDGKLKVDVQDGRFNFSAMGQSMAMNGLPYKWVQVKFFVDEKMSLRYFTVSSPRGRLLMKSYLPIRSY